MPGDGYINYLFYFCNKESLGMKSKRMKSFLLWALAIVAYYVVFQMFYNMVAFRNVFPYEDASVLLKGIRLNFTPILIIFLIDMLIVLVLTRRMKGTPKILVDLALSLVACFLEDACYLALNNNGYVDWAGTVFNNIFIMLGLEVYYYVKNFKESQRLLARQTQLSLQYQMDALKAQVNPHFLFNSLNILYSLVQIDKRNPWTLSWLFPICTAISCSSRTRVRCS